MANFIIFRNRSDAGQRLAKKLEAIPLHDPLIIALPRGGVPVAFEVAKALRAPLHVLIVRKISLPMRPEYGIGAVTEGGHYWIDPNASIGIGTTDQEIMDAIEAQSTEVTRRVRKYRKYEPLPRLEGRTTILIDDGLATGVTARVACHYLKSQGASDIIFAVPVASARTATLLRTEIDEVLALSEPSEFYSVGQFYDDFEQTTDQEVISLLKQASHFGSRTPTPLFQSIKSRAKPLDEPKDLAPLIQELSQSKIVMLGESSHGTHEFYEWRRLISEWLIKKHGFNFIAVEGDWPACWEVNQFVRGKQGKHSPHVLKAFNRWPTWMWGNQEIARLADWMRTHNESAPLENHVGFFGLDVYSFFESADTVLKLLKKISPSAAKVARIRYSCLDPFQKDERAYAKSLIHFPEGCANEVSKNLQSVLKLRLELMKNQENSLFNIEQNARVVANAERYYRAMMHADEDSWNIRDRHMMDTLEHLLDHHGKEAKGIVWAHNTHIGDYRATDMKEQGQVNIGGLAREKWGKEKVALVGFGTYRGTVTASTAWDGKTKSMPVPPGIPGSYEAAFHEVAESLKKPTFYISVRGKLPAKDPLIEVRGHRAIGVVYHPERERFGNYVPTSLANRYDAFLFIDETSALKALDLPFERKDIPETWPGGQ